MKDKYEVLNALQYVFSTPGKNLIADALISYKKTFASDLEEYQRLQQILDNVFDVWKERREV